MEFSSIELKLLRCLVALVEESNVTRAAERVGLSQPRMSNTLRRLRTICNDPILVRAGQRFVPTDRAIVMAASVRQSLDTIEQAISRADTFDPARSRRTFTVMMSDYTAALILPAAMTDIRTAAPDVSIAVVPIDHGHLHRLMDESACDLAFGYFDSIHQNLKISSCFQDYPVCIGRAGTLPSGDSFGLAEFLDAAHVTMGDPVNAPSTLDVVCDRELLALGLQRKIVASAPTPYTLARLVAQTDLIGLLPARMAADYARHLPIEVSAVPLPLPVFNVSMVWHERVHKDPAHCWLRSLFRTVAARTAPKSSY